MTLKAEDVRAWAQNAAIGDDLVYRKPDQDRDENLFEAVRKLSEAGLVFLFQRRAGEDFEHVARRTRPATHDTLDWVSRDTRRDGKFRPRSSVNAGVFQ